MKSKTVIWACLFAGLLWLIVGLRDIFAPGFLTMSPRVMSKLDIIMEFATSAIFLIVAGVFHRSGHQLDGANNK